METSNNLTGNVQPQQANEPNMPQANLNIKLNFINESNDVNNSSVVIFQKNASIDFGELAVAWKVIKNCGRGWNHPFDYPSGFSVGVRDAYGNFSDLKEATFGQKWEAIRSTAGDEINLSQDEVSNSKEVEIQNSLPQGSIDAGIYKDGRLLMTSTNVCPNQRAVFNFKPTIWIGVVSQIDEGELMNSAVISNINTEISLLGITEADIIMTGGGSGPSATAFQFELVPQA